MDAGRCSVICFKIVLEQFFNAEGTEELLYHKESSVGGKFASVKIYNKLLIAFKLDIF